MNEVILDGSNRFVNTSGFVMESFARRKTVT